MIYRFASSPKGEGDLVVLILDDDAECAAFNLPLNLTLDPRATAAARLRY